MPAPPKPTLRIFYDDSCSLCIRSTQSARRWLRAPAEFLSLKCQEARDKNYPDQITVEVIFENKKEKFVAEQAWLALLAHGPWTFRLLSRILAIPPFRWLLAGFYRFIARRRHLWHFR